MLFDRIKGFTNGIIKHKGQTLRKMKAGERISLLVMYSMMFLSALAIGVVMCAQNSKMYLSVQERCGLFEGDCPENRQAVIRMNESVTDFLSGKTKRIENASERANRHMLDVKRIFTWTENTAFVLCTLSAVQVIRKRNASAAISMMPVIFAFLILAFLILSDFNALFYRFHELAFDNDLWLLSPDEDFLIRCLPEEFFYRMAVTALVFGLFIYWIFCYITLLINKFGRRD